MTKTYATEGDLEVLKNELDTLRRCVIEISKIQRSGLEVSERLNQRIGELELDKADHEMRAKSGFWPW